MLLRELLKHVSPEENSPQSAHPEIYLDTALRVTVLFSTKVKPVNGG